MKLSRGNLCNLWLIQRRRKTPLHADKMPDVKDVEGVDNRLTLLWFTEGGPTRAWDEVFAKSGELAAASSLGRVELVAPFIPTLPGTDMYVNQQC